MHVARLVPPALVAALMGASGFVSSVSATTMFPEQFTCPIGGETFEDYVIGSYTSWGQRPDGRAYGTLPVMPVVECPGNGFPIYRDKFTRSEIRRLKLLVESEAYQALRASDTPYYRVWWLKKELGEPPAELANALLVASWETDDDPGRKSRYQASFVETVATIPTEQGKDWFYYNLRAANALRELSRFEEASALLRQVEASPFRPEDRDEREGVRYLIAGLSRLIEEANPHPEPTNLIPPEMAAQRCIEGEATLTVTEREACASEELVDAISNHRNFDFEHDDGDIADAASDSAATADAAMADTEANLEAELEGAGIGE